MPDIADMTAVQTAAAIRNKGVSPVEVVRAALARVAAGESLNAFITVTAQAAMKAAREAAAAVMRGDTLPALHGIPYSVDVLLSLSVIGAARRGPAPAEPYGNPNRTSSSVAASHHQG